MTDRTHEQEAADITAELDRITAEYQRRRREYGRRIITARRRERARLVAAYIAGVVLLACIVTLTLMAPS